MKVIYEITFSDGSSETLVLSLSQASYHVHELANKLAAMMHLEVSTVKRVG